MVLTDPKISQTLIVPEQLGRRIKELRLNLQMSQADLCDDFITLRTLQKIEKGETTPTFEVLLHIANKLQIEMFDLILSSRIPYYLELQLPKISSFVLQDFDNYKAVNKDELQKIETILQEFIAIKLPYPEAVRIETIYALLLEFMYKNRSAAIDILKNLIAKLTLSAETPPTDTEIFQISAYLRLEQDYDTLIEFIDFLQDFPLCYYSPTIAYNINIQYYKHKKWQDIINYSRAVLQNYDASMDNAMIPLLYCQVGVAVFHVDNVDKGAYLFEQGLHLLRTLRQEDNFHMMLMQAHKDNIPVVIETYDTLDF